MIVFQVLDLLQIILPKLASAFEKQKGDIFEFGEKVRPSTSALSTMDSEKLDNAPIHNLGAERSVGFINYELSRRGSKQLGAASSSQVKHRALDLLEKKESGSFKQYSSLSKQGSQLSEIKLQWSKKQTELQAKGLEDKQIANLSVERRKHKDLNSLKEFNGPFTASCEVDKFVESNLSYEQKIHRLYLEVRYARDTSLSLPKTSEIFRLMKSHKKLPIEKYVSNLKLYLDNITTNANVTIQDLEKAIDSLKK